MGVTAQQQLIATHERAASELLRRHSIIWDALVEQQERVTAVAVVAVEQSSALTVRPQAATAWGPEQGSAVAAAKATALAVAVEEEALLARRRC